MASSCFCEEIVIRPDRCVIHRGRLQFVGSMIECALGKSGVTRLKREGDLATPVGVWPMRQVLYRADRLAKPVTGLPLRAISRSDGWCDQPSDWRYNRYVRRPYPGNHEELWRSDRLYDVVVILGHNDSPPVPGAGSAIFFHIASTDYAGTHGCVAVSLGDMMRILRKCGPGTRLRVLD